MKSKKVLLGGVIGTGCIALLTFIVIVLNWSTLFVVFGSKTMRQVELSNWANQKSALSNIQRKILYSFVHKDLQDPDTSGMALAVLNAHIREDEDEIVRNLVHIALTSKSPGNCNMSLTGLRRVSPRHREVSLAIFLYELNHSDPEVKDNWLKLATAVAGLTDYSCQEALPVIIRLTNCSSKYLASAAQNAVKRLQGAQDQAAP